MNCPHHPTTRMDRLPAQRLPEGGSTRPSRQCPECCYEVDDAETDMDAWQESELEECMLQRLEVRDGN